MNAPGATAMRTAPKMETSSGPASFSWRATARPSVTSRTSLALKPIVSRSHVRTYPSDDCEVWRGTAAINATNETSSPGMRTFA